MFGEWAGFARDRNANNFSGSYTDRIVEEVAAQQAELFRRSGQFTDMVEPKLDPRTPTGRNRTALK